MLLGVWVGLIPFVGPYFNFQMQTTDTWHMTNDHLWLSVAPAAALFVGGVLLARGFTRGAATLGGLLAFCGGVWLVIGPTFASLWKGGMIGGGPAFGGTGTRVAESLGFYYGAGALGIMLASYALGYLAAVPFVRQRVAAAAPPTAAPTTATPAPATTGDDGTAVEPPSKRFARVPLVRR